MTSCIRIASTRTTIVFAVMLFLLSGFNAVQAAIPTITSFSPTSGPIGTTVTITGTNFNTTADDNVVFFGATRAVVTAATATSLTVTVPTGATYQNISVTNITTGLTVYSASPFITTFDGSNCFDSLSFAPKADYTTGYSPYRTTIADIDGDGKPDIAVVNYDDNSISIFRNTSNGGSVSFAAKVDFTTGSYPTSISMGDLNGDGKPDLVVTNYLSQTISVFKNTSTAGTISFAAKVDYGTGLHPYCVSIGDLDGDGKPDLAVVSYDNNSISIFQNTSSNGLISFATKLDLPNEGFNRSIIIGDLDGDGKPDLVVVGSGHLSVFRNTSTIGALSFAVKANFGAGNMSVAIGDLDGDGKPDLVVTNGNGNNTISILWNTSINDTVSFATKIDLGTGGNPFYISIGDLDGDGKPDLAVTNSGSNTVSVFHNTSSSGLVSFARRVDYGTGASPFGLSIGDLNGDHKPDLAIANYNSKTVSVLRSKVMPSPTITSFTPTTATAGETVTITGTNFKAGTLVKFGGTPAHSCTVVSTTIINAIVDTGATGSISVTVPAGGVDSLSGFTYTNPPAPTITSFTPTAAKFGDEITITGTNLVGTLAISLGGKAASSFMAVSSTSLKAIVGNGASGSISLTTRSGTASIAGFTFLSPPTITSFSPTSGPIGTTVTITGTNFNTTADNNVVFFGATRATVTAATSTTLTLAVPAGATYENISVTDITTNLTTNSSKPFITTFDGSNGFDSNSFADKASFAAGNNQYSLVSGDVDGDGMPDLVVANYEDNTISVFRNTSHSGSVSFAHRVVFSTMDGGPQGLAIGDLNGDGKPDLAVTNFDGNTVSIFRNTSTRGTVSFATKIDYDTGKWPNSVSIGDLDGDGKLDLAVTDFYDGTVSVLRNIGSNGEVAFDHRIILTAKYAPRSISIGDLDGDGKPDLAVANLSVFRNTSTIGAISFATRIDLIDGGISVSIGDLDGDGKPDLAATNGWGGSTVSIFRNTSTVSSLSFASRIDFVTGVDPVKVSIGDYDGDGKPDLAVLNFLSGTVSILQNTSNNGAISFAAKVDFSVGRNPLGISMCDLNGDGKPDLAVSNEYENTVSVLKSMVGTDSPTVVQPTAIEDKVILYPNPADNVIHINNLHDKTSIGIFNVQGLLVKSIISSGLTENIDITGLAPGFYIVKLSDKGMEETLNFVKKQGE